MRKSTDISMKIIIVEALKESQSQQAHTKTTQMQKPCKQNTAWIAYVVHESRV